MPTNSKREALLQICNFVLKTASEIVMAHDNHPPQTNTKSLFLELARRKIPDDLKQLIKQSVIHHTHKDTPEINKLLDAITKFPSKIFLKGEEKSRTKEYVENSAKNVTYFGVGNCGESAKTCASVWMECTKKMLNAFNLPTCLSDPIPYLEIVEYARDVVELENEIDFFGHSFCLINLPIDANLTSMEEWVKNDNEVVIIDLWKDRATPISINKQLELPEEERSPFFRTFCQDLKCGVLLDVVFHAKLGEGHSNRWLEKNRSPYHFIEQKYPDVRTSIGGQCNDTLFAAQRRNRHKEENHRAHPYRPGQLG